MEVELDRQGRLACLMAAAGACERCGRSDGALEWHHVITRRVRSLRWDPMNALALCLSCHRWWHAHPKLALEWFVERYGTCRLEYLLQVRNSTRGKGGP